MNRLKNWTYWRRRILPLEGRVRELGEIGFKTSWENIGISRSKKGSLAKS